MIHFIHLHLTEELTFAKLLRKDIEDVGFQRTEEINLRWSLWDDQILLETFEMVYEGYLARGAEDMWSNLKKVQYQYGNLIIEYTKP